ncbi:MAG TPA: DEAD/DEAH box helicase, partial [Vicinamibacteria bacterium]
GTRQVRIRSLLRKHRPELKRFSSAIRARTSGRQEALFAEMNLPLLLEAFPLWMSTFRDLAKLAPFEREMFDLIVVDEATQSDMASALPALYRARRAAITGDPQQLRHVSFLSRERRRLLGDEAGLREEEIDSLDYREKSLLDLVDDSLASSDSAIFLDEHFRSMPAIIAFSNREFYGGRLRVMTARPSTLRLRSVALRLVEGRRDESGRNFPEAEAVVAEVVSLVERESPLPKGRCHSIGVLSPFRDQVEHLVGALTERLPLEAIEKHDLLVATPYGFQGEERDVMLLSLAVDEGSHPQAFRHLSQPDVFNVAVTRARSRQVVFASLHPSKLPEGSLAFRYLSEIDKPFDAAPQEGPTDELLEQVAIRLEAAGIRAHRAFLVAGTTVDLVVEREGAALGIDLIGQPGSLGAPLDLERYRMLRRAGLSVFPLPLASWLSDESSCLAAIERGLSSSLR